MKQREFLNEGVTIINRFFASQGVSLQVSSDIMSRNLKYEDIPLTKFHIDQKTGMLMVRASGWKKKANARKNWSISVKNGKITNSLYLKVYDKKTKKENVTVTTPDNILW